MFKRKLGIIFGIMLFFSLTSYFLIAAYGRKPVGEEGDIRIVASFYPVYIITRNLVGDISGVQVTNLTENHTGCLHDYQLAAKDMLELERADILVINGGDMELFILSAVSGLPGLQVVDSSEGTSLLAGGGGHGHGGDAQSGGTGHGAAHTDAGENAQDPVGDSMLMGAAHTGGEENGHIWMDLDRYCIQVRTIADALCRIDPGHAEGYSRNAGNYLEKLYAFRQEYEDTLAGLAGMEVILFHDAFYYLCDELDMEVIHGTNLDADTALSAGEIAEITDEIKLHGIHCLLAEEATGAIAAEIAAENGCQVIYLDPLTSGDTGLDAYLDGMRKNMEILSRIKVP